MNRDNRELVISDFALMAIDVPRVNVHSSYISRLQSISYWLPRPRRQNLSDSSRQFSDWFRLGGLSAAAAADGGGSGDLPGVTDRRGERPTRVCRPTHESPPSCAVLVDVLMNLERVEKILPATFNKRETNQPYQRTAPRHRIVSRQFAAG